MYDFATNIIPVVSPHYHKFSSRFMNKTSSRPMYDDASAMSFIKGLIREVLEQYELDFHGYG